MAIKKENPEALAGARRVDVTPLLSKNDVTNFTPTAFELQVGRIAQQYALSRQLASVLAELIFTGGPL